MSTAVANVVTEAAGLGEFILSDLSSKSAAQTAIKKGYFAATKKVRKTGLRGRPAVIYKLSAKGKKVA